MCQFGDRLSNVYASIVTERNLFEQNRGYTSKEKELRERSNKLNSYC